MSRRIAPKNAVTLTAEEHSIRKTEQGKLIFTAYHGRNCAMLLQNDRLVSVSCLPDEKSTHNISKIGAIYIGKIKNVTKNINACFVEIVQGEICFLPFAKAVSPIMLNRNFDGRLLEGDEILVQVERDAQKTKQASVTANISPETEDYETIVEKATHRTCFSCLKPAPSALENVMNQFLPEEYNEIITDLDSLCGPLQDYVSSHKNLYEVRQCPLPIVRLYQDDLLSLSGVYGLKSKMETALDRRIWLKSGGYLIIEPTEALTVIDVNTGKFEAKKGAEETYLKINLEAAAEIAIQLRLRNLSGIIVADFINMRSKEHRQELMNYLKDAVSTDRIPTVVVDMTPLGLVEITRKKVNKPLADYFKQPR